MSRASALRRSVPGLRGRRWLHRRAGAMRMWRRLVLLPVLSLWLLVALGGWHGAHGCGDGGRTPGCGALGRLRRVRLCNWKHGCGRLCSLRCL